MAVYSRQAQKLTVVLLRNMSQWGFRSRAWPRLKVLSPPRTTKRSGIGVKTAAVLPAAGHGRNSGKPDPNELLVSMSVSWHQGSGRTSKHLLTRSTFGLEVLLQVRYSLAAFPLDPEKWLGKLSGSQQKVGTSSKPAFHRPLTTRCGKSRSVLVWQMAAMLPNCILPTKPHNA